VNTSGYKLVFNVERGAGQVIFHLHLHLIGTWSGMAPDGPGVGP
jgi:histidine triad (HIT) family protein